jgi:hypothetical protein
MAQSLSECEGGCVEDLEARGGEGELTHGKRSDAISGPPHGAPALISASASAGSSQWLGLQKKRCLKSCLYEYGTILEKSTSHDKRKISSNKQLRHKKTRCNKAVWKHGSCQVSLFIAGNLSLT